MVISVLESGGGVKNYQIRPDIKKNTLNVKITNKFIKKEMEQLYTDLRFAVADLNPGFTVIADYSECAVANLDSMPVFGKIMHYLVVCGVGEVVRIMPNPNLFFRQMTNMTARSSGYRPLIVSGAADAEEKLHCQVQRSGIRLHPLHHAIGFRGETCQGTGVILDISLSGCALHKVSELPPAGAAMTVEFELRSREQDKNLFQIPSQVVRISDSSFAVKYTEGNAELKKKLWACLVHECQQEIIGL